MHTYLWSDLLQHLFADDLADTSASRLVDNAPRDVRHWLCDLFDISVTDHDVVLRAKASTRRVT